jgi:hypothetical protein
MFGELALGLSLLANVVMAGLYYKRSNPSHSPSHRTVVDYRKLLNHIQQREACAEIMSIRDVIQMYKWTRHLSYNSARYRVMQSLQKWADQIATTTNARDVRLDIKFGLLSGPTNFESSHDITDLDGEAIRLVMLHAYRDVEESIRGAMFYVEESITFDIRVTSKAPIEKDVEVIEVPVYTFLRKEDEDFAAALMEVMSESSRVASYVESGDLLDEIDLASRTFRKIANTV